MTTPTLRLRLPAALLVFSLVAGACSSAAGPAAATAAGVASAASAAVAGATGAAPAVGMASATVNGAASQVLTGQGGKTLYILTKDTSSASTCTGSCATTWPPLTVPSGMQAMAGSGVMGKLGTISRPDGTMQVTYDGHPLYYFKGDSAGGQANGQGIGGVWYAMGPSGPVGAASGGGSSGSSAAPSSGGGGYSSGY